MISYMKVATAIAVIRSKPPGSTARQYAETLCERFQGSLEHWRNRSELLQNEVLELKQKLALVDILHKGKTSDSRTDTNDKDIPNPVVSVDLDFNLSNTNKKVNSKGFSTLENHNLFLQSVLNLCTNSSTTIINVKHKDLFLSTLNSSLEIIAEWLCRPELPSVFTSRTVEHAVNIMIKISQLTDLDGDIRHSVIEQLKMFIHAVIVSVVSCDGSQCNDHKLILCKVLLNMSTSKLLKVPLTQSLAHCIMECSNHLRRVRLQNALLDPQKVENTYFVFWCLEQILQEDTKSPSCTRVHDYGKLKAILEESLLHIFEDFPLFSHYVWRLVGLIDICLTAN